MKCIEQRDDWSGPADSAIHWSLHDSEFTFFEHHVRHQFVVEFLELECQFMNFSALLVVPVAVGEDFVKISVKLSGCGVLS